MKIETNLESKNGPHEYKIVSGVQDNDSWDAFVKSHRYGSTYHLSAWQRVIHSTFGHEPRHIAARDARRGDLVGVLPLFLVCSRIFGRMLISTPHAAYGGILANSDTVGNAIFERAHEMAKELNVEFLELRHFRN